MRRRRERDLVRKRWFKRVRQASDSDVVSPRVTTTTRTVVADDPAEPVPLPVPVDDWIAVSASQDSELVPWWRRWFPSFLFR